jgi:hypothetical protein
MSSDDDSEDEDSTTSLEIENKIEIENKRIREQLNNYIEKLNEYKNRNQVLQADRYEH